MVLEKEDVACHKYSFVLFHNGQQSQNNKANTTNSMITKKNFQFFSTVILLWNIYSTKKMYSQITVSKSSEITPFFCLVMPSTRYIRGYVLYFQFIEAFKIHVLIMECLYMIPKWNL